MAGQSLAAGRPNGRVAYVLGFVVIAALGCTVDYNLNTEDFVLDERMFTYTAHERRTHNNDVLRDGTMQTTLRYVELTNAPHLPAAGKWSATGR